MSLRELESLNGETYWTKRGGKPMMWNTNSAAVEALRKMEARYEMHRFADGVSHIDDHLYEKPKKKKAKITTGRVVRDDDPVRSAARRAYEHYEKETELLARINALEAENKQLKAQNRALRSLQQ